MLLNRNPLDSLISVQMDAQSGYLLFPPVKRLPSHRNKRDLFQLIPASIAESKPSAVLEQKGMKWLPWGYQHAHHQSDCKKLLDDVDLLLVDHHLETEEDNGDALLDEIRDCNIVVDAIFYSMDDKFSTHFSKRYPEGVFIAYKDNLISRIKQIISRILKRQLEIEYMRGEIISESIMLEAKIENCYWHILVLTLKEGAFAKNNGS